LLAAHFHSGWTTGEGLNVDVFGAFIRTDVAIQDRFLKDPEAASYSQTQDNLFVTIFL